MGRQLSVPAAPERIVSLVPSQTELLFDLGVGERVVGVTRYCLHPDEALRHCAVIGGTKRFDIDRIRELRPDLVIGNKEENYRDGILRLSEFCPVWLSDIESFDDALAMIESVGELANRADAATAMTRRIRAGWSGLPTAGGRPVAYLIWKKPWMAAGCETFIDTVLGRLGFTNVFGDEPRYPEFTLDALRRLRPEIVMLSSEPFPFVTEHVAALADEMPGAHVIRVDGEMFSWYGSRLALAPDYLRTLLAELAV
ncbi:MAG: helical backbone metal receptor [Pseudomonadota bacterium]